MIAPLSKGTILEGRYCIIDVLGQGGFGITYRATDTRIHCDVCIKELCMKAHMQRA